MACVNESNVQYLTATTKEERLSAGKSRTYMRNALCNKEFRDNGVEFDDILPQVSIFSQLREVIKERVILKLRAYFEKFLGLE